MYKKAKYDEQIVADGCRQATAITKREGGYKHGRETIAIERRTIAKGRRFVDRAKVHNEAADNYIQAINSDVFVTIARTGDGRQRLQLCICGDGRQCFQSPARSPGHFPW